VWRSVTQCDAVWRSVLQCVAAYCSVLQCDAVCCSVMQCDAVYWSVYALLLQRHEWASIHASRSRTSFPGLISYIQNLFHGTESATSHMNESCHTCSTCTSVHRVPRTTTKTKLVCNESGSSSNTFQEPQKPRKTIDSNAANHFRDTCHEPL